MIIRTLAAIAVAATAAIGGVAAASDSTPTHHFIANDGGYYNEVAALGYNVLDTNPSPSIVNSLPAGTQAMVWLGSGQKCPTPIDDTFKAYVDSLAGNPNVYGGYLSDEPEWTGCADGPANVRARADYFHSKLPNAKAFIVIDNQNSMAPYAPVNTHVDLVGLDPYPCNVNSSTCDLSKIAERVGWATAGGIPTADIVPTFQVFGQENLATPYYRLPTESELSAMLAEWDRLVPNPQLDYSYGWKNQSSSDPTLIDSPALQGVMAVHNGAATTAPAPAPTADPATGPTTDPTGTPAPTTTTTTATPAPTTTVTVTPPPETVTVIATGDATELVCPVSPVRNAGDEVTCRFH